MLCRPGRRVLVVDDFHSGKRENLNAAADLLEHDIRVAVRRRSRPVFHLAAQADVQTSMKRPGVRRRGERRRHGQRPSGRAGRGAQVIFSSSGGAGYGECPGPVDENFPFLPLSAYGIAKKCGEEYLAGWNRIYGSNHISLRFANVFGPRQDSGLEGGVVAIFLERMARGDETIIFGDGGQVRDFVYVGDIVSALLSAVGRTGGRSTSARRARRRSTICTAPAPTSRRVPHAPRLEEARLGDVRRSVLDAASRGASSAGSPRRVSRKASPSPGRGCGRTRTGPTNRGVRASASPRIRCARPPLADRDGRHRPHRDS